MTEKQEVALETRITALIDERAIVDAAGIKNANEIARTVVRLFKRTSALSNGERGT